LRSDPLGELLSGPNYEGETILTADIDIAACIRGKFDFDVVGHYARPDILQLSVNEAPTEVVRLYRRDGEMKW
jgi:nitrilase